MRLVGQQWGGCATVGEVFDKLSGGDTFIFGKGSRELQEIREKVERLRVSCVVPPTTDSPSAGGTSAEDQGDKALIEPAARTLPDALPLNTPAEIEGIARAAALEHTKNLSSLALSLERIFRELHGADAGANKPFREAFAAAASAAGCPVVVTIQQCLNTLGVPATAGAYTEVRSVWRLPDMLRKTAEQMRSQLERE